MSKIRLIARLDIKGHNLIKGLQLEGLRKIGEPNVFAKKYYDEGIDEIIYVDSVASLYERSSMLTIISQATQNVFIPITVGGGIRNVDDVLAALKAGADKVAVNTAAIKKPELIREISRRFGSQCMVLSIEAKKKREGGWEAYYDNGRERTGKNVLDWAREGVKLGAGEIFLTSVDMDGTERGFDCELVKEISSAVTVPVIASGGMGTLAHLSEVMKIGAPDAVAMGSVLHYRTLGVGDVRSYALKAGLNVRRI